MSTVKFTREVNRLVGEARRQAWESAQTLMRLEAMLTNVERILTSE